MATVGRRAAIADLGWIKLSGFLAWCAWLLVHILFLIGFRNRLIVLFQWTWAYWTFLGATAGPPTEIEMEVAPRFEAGKEVAAGAGCLACHNIGENGNHGPGPELTHIGSQVPRAAIVRSLEIGPGIMPSFRDLPPKKLNELADFLASLD